MAIVICLRHRGKESYDIWKKKDWSLRNENEDIDMTDAGTILKYSTRAIAESVLEICPPGLSHLLLKYELPNECYDDEVVDLKRFHSHLVLVGKLNYVADDVGGLRLEHDAEFIHRFARALAKNGIFPSNEDVVIDIDGDDADEQSVEFFGSKGSHSWCQILRGDCMWRIIYCILYMTKQVLGRDKQHNAKYRRFCAKIRMPVGHNWFHLQHFPGPNGGSILPTYFLTNTPYFPVATETVKNPHPSFAPMPSYFRAQAKPTLQQYIDTFGETAVNNVFLMARAEEEEDNVMDNSNSAGRPSSSGNAYVR